MLTLGGDGQGNATLEIPGMGGQGQGQGSQGQGQARVGPGAGAGHDPTMLDDPTRLDGDQPNIGSKASNRQGRSRSETILGSAQRGFASRDYQASTRTTTATRRSVLEQDEIPSGYRFYVRRYFQLIRPREAE